MHNYTTLAHLPSPEMKLRWSSQFNNLIDMKIFNASPNLNIYLPIALLVTVKYLQYGNQRPTHL